MAESSPGSEHSPGRTRKSVAVLRLQRDGPDAARVLVIALGRTALHQRAPDSGLMHQALDRLWLRTQRGLEVVVVRGATPALHAIQTALESRSVSRYDLIVIALDPAVASHTTARRRLRTTLETVLLQLGAIAPVVVLTIEPDPEISPAAAFELSDTVTATAIARSIRLTVERVTVGRAGSADTVARLLEAELITDTATTSATDRQYPTPPPLSPVAVSPSIGRRLAQITRIARTAFDAESAAIDLAQGRLLIPLASDGEAVGPRPQAESLCDLAMRYQGLVVVPNTHALPSPSSYRAVAAEPPVRFYAGYPINLTSPKVRGVLSVYDHLPHQRDEHDFTLLRDLAQLVEAELSTAGSR